MTLLALIFGDVRVPIQRGDLVPAFTPGAAALAAFRG
jgi:hypothetical protein